MKFITIGDLHGLNVWKEVAQQALDDDKMVIFLGDYVDSFTISNEEILHNLKEIIEFKIANPLRVILLWANHDVQYWLDNPYTHEVKYRCSGFRPEMMYDLYDLFKNNSHLFQLAYQHKNYIWTHAGIHRGWYEYKVLPFIKDNGLFKESYNVAAQLNELFYYRSELIFHCGYLRGGNNQIGGPLWADRQETWSKPLKNHHQIVGHSRVKDIMTNKLGKNTSITYCDCLENGNIDFYEIEIL